MRENSWEICTAYLTKCIMLNDIWAIGQFRKFYSLSFQKLKRETHYNGR